MTQLRDLYERALEIPASDREDWLQVHCPEEAQRARLNAMLHALETESAALIDRPAAERIAAFDDARLTLGGHWIGKKLGAFRLHRLIGQGGMAAVFLASRENADFEQQVAVKLLQRGLYSEFEQQLFRRERQALASLTHPHIARLIDGGIADSGVPYLAMEYVDGVPITDFCRAHLPDLSARLRLFVVVCRAVDAAHRALIVHRDIKPSNILVTADGSVKLLDFGISKLLGKADEATTQTGLAALTPEYAAPEQFDGSSITTATDVYSLGVLLHELLLGERPDRENTQRPSQRAAHSSPHAALAATPNTLRRQLKGDLDNIILKALQAEPRQRYASAGSMADDIERHLLGQPVSAHPPSTWYRTRKFIRRHRGGVGVTILLVLGILASLGAAIWQARVAQQEAARANTVRDFMVDLLARTAPTQAQADRPDIPELVYIAASALPEELKEQPEIRIELLITLGNVLRQMSDLRRSETLLREANRLAQTMPEDSMLRVTSEFGLARTLLKKNELQEAADRVYRLLDLSLEHLAPEITRGMLLKAAMGIEASRGESVRAVAMGEEMLKVYRSDCDAGVRCDDLAFAENDFGSVLIRAGRFADSMALLKSAVARKRANGAAIGSLANSLNILSFVLVALGDLDAAQAAALESRALYLSLGDGLFRVTLDAPQQVAEVLLAKEDFAAAEALLQEVAAEQIKRGVRDCERGNTGMHLTRALLYQGRHQVASDTALDAIARDTACPVFSNWANGLIIRFLRVRAFAELGKRQEAGELYEQLLGERKTWERASPYRRMLLLADAMHAALALQRPADARDFALQLRTASHASQLLTNAPQRLEAEIVLHRLQTPNAPSRPDAMPIADLVNALATIQHWPVGVRLQKAFTANP